MRKSISFILLMSLIINSAFAVCESERKDYENSKSNCSKQEALVEACGVAAGIAGAVGAIFTLGASVAAAGLACTIPALTAQNACRIRDERLSHLNGCVDHQNRVAAAEAQAQRDAAHARAVAAQQQADLAEAQRLEGLREQDRLNKINAVNAEAQTLTEQANAEFRNALVLLTDGFVQEGIDLNQPDTNEVVLRTTEDLRLKLSARIHQIELDRQAAVAAF